MAHTKRIKVSTPAVTKAPAAQNGNGSAPAPRSGVKDLSELFANRTAVITIYDPRDEYLTVKRDTGFRFELAPVWSPEAQKVVDEYRDKIRRIDGKIDQADPKLAESVLNQIITVTKRFWQEPDSPDGIILDGVLLTPSPENARKIYTHPDLWWLYEDLQVAYMERGRFFGSGSKGR
jgi:hypothetical protein